MNTQDLFFRNNTGNKSKSAIISGFVVRTNEFEHIKNALLNAEEQNPLSNIIIIGQRGAGKTTLMHRLNYAILDDKKLKKKYLPIVFSEEQYNLSDLTTLWEAVAVGIEDNFSKTELSSNIEKIIDSETNFEELSFQVLNKFLNSENKTAVLFIENLNFFLKKLNNKERERLRQILTSESSIRIIGSSTSSNDGTINLTDSSYDYFSTISLDGLSQEECVKLLIRIGEQYGEENQIREIISKYPGRVEALRRLTGGVPRTISYLFQIFLDNENGKAIKDLYILIDTLTLLYKSELDQLSTQQQKVIDAIAKKWDAISVKEIAKRTRLESKNISSILSLLEKNQFIEKVPTSTKNHLYRIRERFMNIWYLMRFGRKHDKENVIWLVRFFDAWCDESELTKRLKNHIINLKDGNYDTTAAIDMGNTFLSCENIPENLKEELIKTTNSVLPDRLLQNAKTSKDSLATIERLIKEDQIDEALELLEKITDKTIDYYMLAISVYLKQNNIEKIVEATETAWKLNEQNSSAAITMGIINETYLNNTDKAIEFYETSLNLPQPHPYAASRLGDIYRRQGNFEKAIKYYKKAVAKNFKQALLGLASSYSKLENYAKAEETYNEAVIAEIEGANTSLGKFLTRQKRFKEALPAFLKAVELHEKDSNLNLGKFYLMQKTPSFKKAEEQFLNAISNGDASGYNQLARMYMKQNKKERAIATFEVGQDNNDPESAHQLGHLYSRMGDFARSDEMFTKAIELGDEGVVGCWIQSIFSNKRKDKKQFALDLLEKYRPEEDNLAIDLMNAKILLWNDRLQDSLNIIDKQTKNLKEIYEGNEDDDKDTQKAISELVEFFLLLIAKKEFKIAYEFFTESAELDYKNMLKPIYYVLMDELKDEFPTEYLKAGDELIETINDLKKEVENMRDK
jgi:tetratricopeptide (TPR) repeat protein